MKRTINQQHPSGIATAAPSSTSAESSVTPAPHPDLEPLAEYLAPQFGNIYDYNHTVDERGYDAQLWTPELKAAVRDYIVHETNEGLYAIFLDELIYKVPPGSRQDQAEFIIEEHEAWRIAYAFHLAAVKAVPTLDQLIGQHREWPVSFRQEDVGEWLVAHATKEQLTELAELTDHPECDPSTPSYQPDPTGWDLAWNLTPPELLDAWHHVVGQPRTQPSPSSQVRAWARAHGYQVGERGRVPKRLVERWEQQGAAQ